MSFKWHSWQKWKISMLVLGLRSTDRKATRDNANIRNPKVNRGCPPLTANCTSTDCVQISLGPSIQYIPLRVYHTEGFNAISLDFSSYILLIQLLFATGATQVPTWFCGTATEFLIKVLCDTVQLYEMWICFISRQPNRCCSQHTKFETKWFIRRRIRFPMYFDRKYIK